MTQIFGQTVDQQRRQLDLSDNRVAAPAKKSTDAARLVAVINDECASGRVTQEASSILRFVHLVHLLRSEPVLPLQSRPKVLRPGGLRVGSAPLSQSFVPALAVRLAVLSVAATRALSTLSSLKAPIRESIIGQIAGALAATGHALIMQRNTNTRPLDQPCHADVLLAIANGGDPR